MKKYIIKNCLNYLPEFSYFDACKCEKGSSINGKYMDNCKDVTDCLLKQIVEKCKNKADLCKNCMGNFLLNGCEKCSFNTHGLAQDILSLLEIEEINE